jgi:DNA-binding phage protein
MTIAEPADRVLQALASERPGYRRLLLASAGESLLEGDPDMAAAILRDVVFGHFGAEAIASATGLTRETIRNVLADGASPDAGVLLIILSACCRLDGVHLKVAPSAPETSLAAE